MTEAKDQITHETEGNTVYLSLNDKRVVRIIGGGNMEYTGDAKSKAAMFAGYCRKNDIAYTPRIQPKKKPAKKKAAPKEDDKDAVIAQLKAKLAAVEAEKPTTSTVLPGTVQKDRALNRDGLSYKGSDVIYPGKMDKALGVKDPEWQKWCQEHHPDLYNALSSTGRL